jgi:hypothetical protein
MSSSAQLHHLRDLFCFANCLRAFDHPGRTGRRCLSPMVIAAARARLQHGRGRAASASDDAVMDMLQRFDRPVGSPRDTIDKASQGVWL